MAIRYVWSKYTLVKKWKKTGIDSQGSIFYKTAISKYGNRYKNKPIWNPEKNDFDIASPEISGYDLPFYFIDKGYYNLDYNKKRSLYKIVKYDDKRDAFYSSGLEDESYTLNYYAGKYLGKVYSTDKNAYPDGYEKGGYYYYYEGTDNTPPILYDSTQTNKTLYENNVLVLNGTAKDDDNEDVVTVKYQVNSGDIKVISAGVSSTSYNKTLQFKEGYLYDGNTKISSKLANNTKHTIKIWAEDDKDNKSDIKTIGFYVVNNRPANIQIDPIVDQTDLVETDYVKITGKIEDPEKDETTLYYKINSKPLLKVNTGSNRTFEVRVPVKDLVQGENQLIVRAEDSYGAITERTIVLNKQGNSIPLKEGFIEYKLLPPEGETDGLLLWIEREVGDLETEVHVKFGNKDYKKIDKSYVGIIEAGVLEEDEYIIENDTKVKDIFLRITMKRNSTNSKRGIRKISGVFN